MTGLFEFAKQIYFYYNAHQEYVQRKIRYCTSSKPVLLIVYFTII